MVVGPQTGLQAVCTSVLARVPCVLARVLGYAQRALAHAGPCVQARAKPLASRYK